jgi:hypothetical protein
MTHQFTHEQSVAWGIVALIALSLIVIWAVYIVIRFK